MAKENAMPTELELQLLLVLPGATAPSRDCCHNPATHARPNLQDREQLLPFLAQL